MTLTPSKRSAFLPREGITLDPILLFLRRFTHPVLLLPLLAVIHPRTSPYLTPLLPQSLPLPTLSPAWIKRLRFLAYLGLFHRLNAFLSKGSLNNWAKDETWNWDKEVIVVTGGSAGIGKEVVLWLSRVLLERGKKGKIIVFDIMELGYEAPGNVSHVKVDLSSYESIKSAAESIRSSHGAPTVLISNAGICLGTHILNASPAGLSLLFNVNTLAQWYLAQEFLPSMIVSNHGHIVTVASVGAYVQAPKMVDYNASKAAAMSFHEGLGIELRTVYKAEKVRTTLVTPGYVKTPLFEGYNNTSKFLLPAMEPETVGEEIGKAVLSGMGGHIILPRGYHAMTGIRGWFSWIQLRVLAGANRVMDGWRGRRVIDPDTHERKD
ncbi:hypothetical protein BGX38DRAFT_1167134 [Terfezia claveryi]|nr:hypothetical protein BGX38DRAFT_1241410 [Terfezia claveryi]KAF8455502.1 hypothetical protein BGX38DRAFT_1167134 [Terfezia claveryi]